MIPEQVLPTVVGRAREFERCLAKYTLEMVTCVLAVRLRVPGLWLWLCVMCVKSNLMSAKTQCPLQISAAVRPAQIGLAGRLYKEFGRENSWGPKSFEGGEPISGGIPRFYRK